MCIRLSPSALDVILAVRKERLKDLCPELDQTVQLSIILHAVIQRSAPMTINVHDVSVDVEDVFLVTVQNSRFRVSCALVGFVKLCILHCFVDLLKVA